MSLKERIRTSLFLKIILLFLVAHVTIGTIGISVHRFLKIRHVKEAINENLIDFADLISNEIGSPPDTLLAQTIGDKYNIVIRIRFEDNMEWASNQAAPLFDDFTEQFEGNTDSVRSGMIGLNKFVQLSKDSTQYLFGFGNGNANAILRLELRILIMVISMMLVLFLLYLGIRIILKPVKEMDKAVAEFSKGNLNYQVKSRRHDELGELTRSLNGMSHRIQEMIQARDQLLLDASHELRSPLTRVKVALEFLEEDQIRQTIQDDIGEMETMISELLESERLDSPYGGLHLEKIDLNEILDLVIAEQSDSIPGIEWERKKEICLLNADADRLKIAFNNLVQNACKYSDPEGNPIQIHMHSENNRIRISVRDFGQGIPEKDIPFIFEPFYRVDKSRAKNTGGYGLGLSLTKKIIEAHNGSIEVNSLPEEGTEMIIHFNSSS